MPSIKGVIPVEHLRGDNDADTALLREMAQAAREFIQSFVWCKSVRQQFFGDGFGGIVAIFLVCIEPSRTDVDEWLWVIVGDLPSAYLVTDNCKSPSEALEGYIEEMSRWVELAKLGHSSNDVIPVGVPATPEFAAMLEKRLEVLQRNFVPAFQQNEQSRA